MRHLFFFILFFPFTAAAQLQVAKIFSDNMVLQREQPVHVWGKGIPGKQVEVTFISSKREVTIKRDSSWIVEFGKQKASAKPNSILISSGDDKIELKNILIGDIWVCLGQSNMEWPMAREMHFKDELQNSNQSQLRFYNPIYAGKNVFGTLFTDSVAALLNKNNFYQGKWQYCDSNSIKTMSAVGYYFGKEIIKNENIPVGLINLSVGGAPLETFIAEDVLKRSSKFSGKMNGNWLLNEALPVWVRERGKQNVESVSTIASDQYGKNHAFKPGFVFECGIEPILEMPIKGIIFYHGESNAQETERVNEYGELFKLMVSDYRKKWGQQALAFYYVQLSSIDTLKYKGQLWPQFRDEQRRILDNISNTGMAVSTDIGFKDDVHPTNKKDVGERLARWALNKSYHKKILPSGPLPLKAKYLNGKIVISFQYTGERLETSDKNPVKGFSLDGRKETPAIIQDKAITIAVKDKPAFIYYGWKSFSDGNLVNSEQLPASTFKLKIQ